MELEQITAEHNVTERSSSEKKSILINVPLDKLVASVVNYQVRNTVLFPRWSIQPILSPPSYPRFFLRQKTWLEVKLITKEEAASRRRHSKMQRCGCVR